MKIEVVEVEGDLRLVFRGSALVQDAESIATSLLGVLGKGGTTVLADLSSIDAADVSFFQILWAFGLSLAASGRHLVVMQLPDDHPLRAVGELLGLRLEHSFTSAESTK